MIDRLYVTGSIEQLVNTYSFVKEEDLLEDCFVYHRFSHPEAYELVLNLDSYIQSKNLY